MQYQQAKPALPMPLEESTMSVPYWWNTVLLVHTSHDAELLGPVATEGNTEQPGRRHCRCRRRPQPQKGREEVRGVCLFLIFFLFLLDERSSCIDCSRNYSFSSFSSSFRLLRTRVSRRRKEGGGVHVVAASQRRPPGEEPLPRSAARCGHSAATRVEETARPHSREWRLLCPYAVARHVLHLLLRLLHHRLRALCASGVYECVCGGRREEGVVWV